MNKRFPVLSTVSALLKVVGWLVVVAGVLYAAYEGVIEPNLPSHSFGGEDAFQLISGVVVGLIGLLTVAFSEVIGVLFAIEENTRTKGQ
jgi:formate-dependent nitrite reductase membrane component NrfD